MLFLQLATIIFCMSGLMYLVFKGTRNFNLATKVGISGAVLGFVLLVMSGFSLLLLYVSESEFKGDYDTYVANTENYELIVSNPEASFALRAQMYNMASSYNKTILDCREHEFSINSDYYNPYFMHDAVLFDLTKIK